MEPTFLFFRTCSYRAEFTTSSDFPQKVEIFPSDGYYEILKWNFSYLSAFLNQLHNFITIDHSYRSDYSKKYGKNAKFLFICKSTQKDDLEIFIYICQQQIIVKVNNAYLNTEMRSCNDILKSPILISPKLKEKLSFISHIYFLKIFLITDCSKALWKNNSLLFFSKFDFSKVYHFFSKHIEKFLFCQIKGWQNVQNFDIIIL